MLDRSDDDDDDGSDIDYDQKTKERHSHCVLLPTKIQNKNPKIRPFIF